MLTLEEAQLHLTPEDFKRFENLFWMSQSEEYLSAQWYTIRQMMQEILIRNNCDDKDPFDFGQINEDW